MLTVQVTHQLCLIVFLSRTHEQRRSGLVQSCAEANCLPVQFFYSRDAMLARVLAMTLCPSVSVSVRLSVTSRCSIEMDGQIELVFGMYASFGLSYTVL